MMLDWNDYRKQLLITIDDMATLSPDTVRGYRQLSEAGTKPGRFGARAATITPDEITERRGGE